MQGSEIWDEDLFEQSALQKAEVVVIALHEISSGSRFSMHITSHSLELDTLICTPSAFTSSNEGSVIGFPPVWGTKNTLNRSFCARNVSFFRKDRF